MVLLASVLAAIVSQAGLGQAPAVRVPDYQLQSILELPLILGFGACCGAVSASFAYSNQVMPACAWTVLQQANLNLAFVSVGCLDIQKIIIEDWNDLFKELDNEYFKSIILGNSSRTCMWTHSWFLSEFRGRVLMNLPWSHRIICTDSMTCVCSAVFCNNSAAGCASAIITSICTCGRPAAWQQTKSLACAHFCFQRLAFEPQQRADPQVMITKRGL